MNMKTKVGRKPKYSQAMQLFFLRMTQEQIKRLQALALRNGYSDRKSGGVSGYARDLLLKELKG
jgi:hypothetical protein